MRGASTVIQDLECSWVSWWSGVQGLGSLEQGLGFRV